MRVRTRRWGIIRIARSTGTERPLIASGISPAAKSSAGFFESNFDRSRRPIRPGQIRRVRRGERPAGRAAHVNGSRIDPSRLSVEFPDSWFHAEPGVVEAAGVSHVKPAVGELDGKP